MSYLLFLYAVSGVFTWSVVLFSDITFRFIVAGIVSFIVFLYGGILNDTRNAKYLPPFVKRVGDGSQQAVHIGRIIAAIGGFTFIVLWLVYLICVIFSLSGS